jgi:hypothetical protein
VEEHGIDETADLRFVTDSSKLVTTTDKALSNMGQEFIFVQTGVLNSRRNARCNQYTRNRTLSRTLDYHDRTCVLAVLYIVIRMVSSALIRGGNR